MTIVQFCGLQQSIELDLRRRQILIGKLLAAELKYPYVSLGTQAATANPDRQAIGS